MSLSEQNEIVLAERFVPDNPRGCIRQQTNRTVKWHLPDYLRQQGFSERARGRFQITVPLGPMSAACTFTVHATFGREVQADVHIAMLAAYHQASRDNSQEVSLSGAVNFLKAGDIRRDNRRVARSIDAVFTAARRYFRNLILGMRSYQVYFGENRFDTYHNLQIVEGTEEFKVSSFEVSHDFRSTSPRTTVRSLAPRIHALALRTGEQSLRYGEDRGVDGLVVWAYMPGAKEAVLYVKTPVRVRLECKFKRRAIRPLAVSVGRIEIFSETFFRAAQQFAPLANSLLQSPVPIAAGDARTAYDFFSRLSRIVPNDTLRTQILDSIVATGEVPARLHYRFVRKLALGARPILYRRGPGIYGLSPEYERFVRLAQEVPGITRPSKRQRRVA